jgi:hypothetical protein
LEATVLDTCKKLFLKFVQVYFLYLALSFIGTLLIYVIMAPNSSVEAAVVVLLPILLKQILPLGALGSLIHCIYEPMNRRADLRKAQQERDLEDVESETDR